MPNHPIGSSVLLIPPLSWVYSSQHYDMVVPSIPVYTNPSTQTHTNIQIHTHTYLISSHPPRSDESDDIKSHRTEQKIASRSILPFPPPIAPFNACHAMPCLSHHPTPTPSSEFLLVCLFISSLPFPGKANPKSNQRRRKQGMRVHLITYLFPALSLFSLT
ncbi:hypothetical protein DL98DRAFT_1445 [Cadophora sp. DSE1049]|nr:hypothetical protein DL98DRAFT_1445 [Cadophora sp. DSE1049]